MTCPDGHPAGLCSLVEFGTSDAPPVGFSVWHHRVSWGKRSDYFTSHWDQGWSKSFARQKDARRACATSDCECGRLKQLDQEGCPSCLWLDGDEGSPTRACIISELRVMGGAGVSTRIAAAMGVKLETAERTLYRMRKTGRLQVKSREQITSSEGRSTVGYEVNVWGLVA